MLIGDFVKVKQIISTGKRYVPRTILWMTGKIIAKRSHHGESWFAVSFKQEKPSFSHMIFGNAYYDFLEEELAIV